MLKTVVSFMPERVRHRLWIWRHQGIFQWPPVGKVTPESLWRLRPISRVYGLDRGQPIDRFYIERFLAQNAQDVQGRVLEVADAKYTKKFGGNRVTQSDVIHVESGHADVTIVGDFTKGDNLPSDTFDCIILTQTLPFIFELRAAVETLYRILKPSGVLLATTPGITKISRYDRERWGHYWSLTSHAMEQLFSFSFPQSNIAVQSFGNVLSATAFLQGLASSELSQNELDYQDPDFELIITLRAQKPQHSNSRGRQ